MWALGTLGNLGDRNIRWRKIYNMEWHVGTMQNGKVFRGDGKFHSKYLN